MSKDDSQAQQVSKDRIEFSLGPIDLIGYMGESGPVYTIEAVGCRQSANTVGEVLRLLADMVELSTENNDPIRLIAGLPEAQSLDEGEQMQGPVRPPVVSVTVRQMDDRFRGSAMRAFNRLSRSDQVRAESYASQLLALAAGCARMMLDMRLRTGSTPRMLPLAIRVLDRVGLGTSDRIQTYARSIADDVEIDHVIDLNSKGGGLVS